MYDGIDGVFFITIITLTCGFFSLVVRYCYRSKCNQIDVCCIKITRNIQAEVQEDLELGNTEESKK